MSRELTVLVHGFNKNRNDMKYLADGLNSLGFKTVSVNLPTTFGTLEQSVNSLYLQMKDLAREAETINYVAHSMGGLIVRKYIALPHQYNIGKCIFISTPHLGSRLAQIANHIPLYSMVFQPIKNLVPGSKYEKFGNEKKFKIGIISGNKNSGLLGKIFLSKMSDGYVEIESAKSDDADDFVILPFGHKEIHHKQATLSLLVRFLLNGRFNDEKK